MLLGFIEGGIEGIHINAYSVSPILPLLSAPPFSLHASHVSNKGTYFSNVAFSTKIKKQPSAPFTYARVYTHVLHFHFHPSHHLYIISHYQRNKYSVFVFYSKCSMKKARRTHVSPCRTHVVSNWQIFDRWPWKYKCEKTVHRANYRFFYLPKYQPSHLQPAHGCHSPNGLSDSQAFSILKTYQKPSHYKISDFQYIS